MTTTTVDRSIGALTPAQRRYKRALLRQLARQIRTATPPDPATELGRERIRAGITEGDANQVHVELVAELDRRAAGTWRRP